MQKHGKKVTYTHNNMLMKKENFPHNTVSMASPCVIRNLPDIYENCVQIASGTCRLVYWYLSVGSQHRCHVNERRAAVQI